MGVTDRQTDSAFVMPEPLPHPLLLKPRVPSCLSLYRSPDALHPCRHPVFVLGEAGLKKSHIGALVHYTSADSHLPLVKVDFEATRDPAAVLFGSNGSSGLLESLQQTGGTLLLNNVHVVSREGRHMAVGLLTHAGF